MKSLHYLSQKIIPLMFLSIIIIPAQSSAQATGVARFLGNFVSPMGGPYISGCWGWTDTVTGREYALLGNLSGTSIVEITDTDNIIERDFIPGPTSGWRELQTYSHYAYVVSEGGGGTQIIDLSSLPNPVRLVKNFVYKSGSDSTSRAHTIQIRGGYMYLNGCARWARGGVVIFSLADPEQPQFISHYTSGNYIHDSFVRNDTMFAAAIYGIGLEIVDVTKKAFPQHLFTITYPGSGTHNAATTTDGKYVLTTDEIGSTAKTLKIWDLSTPPVFPKVAEYVGDPSTIVHNVFVKDSLAIMSYYKAGVKIVNIVDPTAPFEIGGYDTYPDSIGGGQYNGAWSVYPFFPSGKIIIGDMVSGLYIIDMNSSPSSVDRPSEFPAAFVLQQNYPNPFNPTTTIEYSIPSSSTVSLEVFSVMGQHIATLVNSEQHAGTHRVQWNGVNDVQMPVSSGMYMYSLRAFTDAGKTLSQQRTMFLVR